MKHINLLRGALLLASGIAALVFPVLIYFMEQNIAAACLSLAGSLLLFSAVCLMNRLHTRYTDALLEQLALLMESLLNVQALPLFPDSEDTLLSRLQSQVYKLQAVFQKQNEQLRLEKEQMKTLVSDLTHQIKTPAASLQMFVELLQNPKLEASERAEYLEILRLSVQKLLFLTDGLVKLSRLESGIIQLRPQPAVVNDLVLQAVKQVCHRAKEKQIGISFENSTQYTVPLDMNWTTEAIANILDNAVKYTRPGGSVSITLSEYPSYVRLDIADDGFGIPEAEQARIFQRFYRGSQSAGVEGVGIGLYLTRKIITDQHGYVKVSSHAKGSTFSLFLRKGR